MAMTFEQFLAASNAEVVGGDLIVGVMKTRRTVGSIATGTFVLNDEGQALLAEYEAAAAEAESAPKSKTKAA